MLCFFLAQNNDQQQQLELIHALCDNTKRSSGADIVPLPPRIQNSITDYRQYIGQAVVIDFINAFLTLDPEQRITIDAAIKVEFLKPKPSPDIVKALLCNYSTGQETAEASSHPIPPQGNSQQQRTNMSKGTYEPIY